MAKIFVSSEELTIAKSILPVAVKGVFFFLGIFERCQPWDTDLRGTHQLQCLHKWLSWWEGSGCSSQSSACEPPTWLDGGRCQPAVLCGAGLGGQLCLCRQLCPCCQLCLCSRAAGGWNHNSFPLLASWAACPWDAGMRAVFNSNFYGVPLIPL